MEQYVLKENPDGSVITVRDVQNVLLSMLKDVDKVLKEYSIPYFLNGGSALGAIRHKGFIPWDDDADIGVLREDYDRLLEALKHLPDKYLFQCFENDKRYNVLIPNIKIRLKGTYLEEANKLLSNRCTGYEGCDGLFIDIFAYDSVSLNKMTGIGYRIANYLLMVPEIIADNYLHINPVHIKKLIVWNARRYARAARRTNTEYVGFELTWLWNGFYPPYNFTKEELLPVKYVPFEDTYLPVPNQYDVYLRRYFGDSYMQFPPENKRFAKHITDIRL